MPHPSGLEPIAIPSRRASRRRDRRGRGLRGPLLPPGMPAARSRAELFEDSVLEAVEHLEQRWARQLEGVEFAVEDVPPSEPSPWERGPAMGRSFAADPVAGLKPRIVLYRRVVEARCDGQGEIGELVHAVVVEQVARLLNTDPATIDPNYRAD